MRYLLLIHSDESHYANLSEEENGKLMAEYAAFGESLESSGAYLESARLQPVATTTTVRERNGDAVVTDGPFAETKEQLGGFYMIEAKDLDEATKWARKIPSARWGAIEVRPIWEMEDE